MEVQTIYKPVISVKELAKVWRYNKDKVLKLVEILQARGVIIGCRDNSGWRINLARALDCVHDGSLNEALEIYHDTRS